MRRLIKHSYRLPPGAGLIRKLKPGIDQKKEVILQEKENNDKSQTWD